MNTSDFRSFLTAGNATFTVTSKRTGTRFTYRVRSTDSDRPQYFVSVLTGPDNDRDYTYAGTLSVVRPGVKARSTLKARQTPGSKVAADAPSWRGFCWLLGALDGAPGAIDSQATVHHVGRCGRCGRALTVPESIESGLGPVCAEKVVAGA